MPYLVATADELMDQFGITTRMPSSSSLTEALNAAEQLGWRLITVTFTREQETYVLHKEGELPGTTEA